MKIIRDGQTLIGALEVGELNKDFSDKLHETLNELNSMSADNPKVQFKGAITLKLALTVAGGMVTINTDIATKLPRRPRRSSTYWVTDNGQLSTEHPQQQDIFSGPRDVGERDRVRN